MDLDKNYSFSNGIPRMVSLDLSSLSKGIYLLKVKANNKSVVKRLVISD